MDTGLIMRRILGVALFAAVLHASAEPAADTPPVSEHYMQLPTEPALELRIDGTFKPLGTISIVIANSTQAYRRIFVDADESSLVRRLVVVQFERVLPGVEFKFVYPPKPPAEYGGLTYRFGAYVYDDAAAAAKAPELEAGRTRAMLTGLSYKLPRLMRTARLARVAAADGSREVIIFYMENADADYPLGPLAGADEDGDLPLDAAAKEQILERLRTTVSPAGS